MIITITVTTTVTITIILTIIKTILRTSYGAVVTARVHPVHFVKNVEQRKAAANLQSSDQANRLGSASPPVRCYRLPHPTVYYYYLVRKLILIPTDG